MAKLMADLQTFESSQSAVFADQKALVEQLTAETSGALVGLDGRLSAAVADTRQGMINEFQTLNDKLHTWTVGVKAGIEALRSGKGASGPARAFGSDGKVAGGGINKTEVAVWKLPEDVSKVQYRHWSNAVDIQLQAVHGWSCSDYIINRVKRCPDPMTAEMFERCLAEASVDISSDSDIYALAPDASEYPFAEKTKFLYAYLMGKLSMDLYDRVASIESKHGFEVYRQIAQMIDAVPENAEFVMNAELLQLASIHGPKVRDLKSLYAVRLLLKKRTAEYRKIIGSSPKDEQNKLIL